MIVHILWVYFAAVFNSFLPGVCETKIQNPYQSPPPLCSSLYVCVHVSVVRTAVILSLLWA